eukprot:scaffold323497_cov59-Attheya_sp.AAC.1
MEKSTSFRVAPWHFSPENRKRDENGRWVVRKREVYLDYDRVKYAFPPPNYNPTNVVTEVRMEKHGIERRCTTQNESSSLPVPQWFGKMQHGGAGDAGSSAGG